MRLFIYLSELIGNLVIDMQGDRIGRLNDIVMNLNNDMYPRASGIIVSRGIFRKRYALIALDKISIFGRRIHLKIEQNDMHFQIAKIKCEFALRRDIFDQQVVDTDHQKVVRVNDVHLLRVDNQIHLAHVDVGLRGLVRRLGWSPAVDGMVKTFNATAPYLSEEALIPWKNTQAFMLSGKKNVLKTDIARQKLSKIPPTALAEIMQDLDIFEKEILFKSFDAKIQRLIFADLAPDDQDELLDQMDNKEAVNLLSNIPADEATDLLMRLPKEKMQQLLRLMESKTAKELRMLLGFEKDSAGGLMTTEYLSLKDNATVKDAMQKVKTNADYPGNLFFLYIVDDQNRYIGTTTLRRFINEPETKLIIETCYEKKVFVNTDSTMEEIALLLEQYKFSSIPVLNEQEEIQGVITIDDVMEELISLAWTKYRDQL